MANTFACKSNSAAVLERLRSFYERRSDDCIFATMSIPSPAFEDFARRYPQPECEYPDPNERADFWDKLFSERMTLEDDSMPGAYLSEFDQGLIAGMVGGEVRFLAHHDSAWVSSMLPPVLKDWSEFDRLHFEESNIWYQRYLNQIDVFLKRGRGRWGISHLIMVNGLGFVFELIGATNTYLSLDEHPDYVRRALKLAYDLNGIVQDKFFEIVPLFEGGTLSNFGQWMPGRIVSEGLDVFHMTSPAYFEKWGREPTERLLDRYDGGVIHIHGNGRHLLETAGTIKGLKAVLFLDDRGFTPSFDIVGDMKAQLGGLPVAVFANYPQFIERLNRHDLPGGVLYQVKNVPDVITANRLMEKVRNYRV